MLESKEALRLMARRWLDPPLSCPGGPELPMNCPCRLKNTLSSDNSIGPTMAPCKGLSKVAMPPKMPRPVK